MCCTSCCPGADCCSDKIVDEATKLVPYEERETTDVIALLLFIVSWIISFYLLGASVGKGDPNRLLYGNDVSGNICGISAGYEDLPYAMWPYPPAYEIKVCVADCAETQTSDVMVAFYETVPYLDAYCFPDNIAEFTEALYNATQAAFSEDEFVNGPEGSGGIGGDSLSRAMSDVLNSKTQIILSAFLALLLSLGYTKFVQWAGACMVWVGIGLMLLGGVLMGYALLEEATEREDTDPDTADGMRIAGYVIFAATFIFFLILVFLKNRIAIAIEVVKTAAQAVADMKFLLFFPIFPFLFFCLYALYWCVISLYIFSVSNPTEPVVIGSEDFYENLCTPVQLLGSLCGQEYIDYEWDDSMENFFAYHFFHLLWVAQFLIYFNYMVVAGAIGAWYFTRTDSNGNKKRGDGEDELSASPVMDSAKRTLRFHLGSIAVGSLIIAIIQFIRAVVKYIEEQSKKGGEPNRLQKYMFAAIQCCLACAECCMDKINQNTYVWIAIRGDSFIPATCSSFALVWANLARVAAINLVGEYLLFIGKVMVAALTSGIMGLWIMSAAEVNSLFMPCAIIFVISLSIAHLFMILFDTSIDCIFLCFLIDEKHNKSNGMMYASEELKELINAHAAESAAQAKLLKQKELKSDEE